MKRYPELFHAFVGIGQLIHPLENDRVSYQFTLETAKRLGNKRAIEELRKIGPPPYNHERLAIQRKWLTAFDERLMKERFDKTPPNYRKKLLSTPEYSLFDILKMGIDPFFSTRHLWNEEFYRVNLFEQVASVEIPVFFLADRQDYFTPSKIVERYYQQLIAPQGKALIWF